jgi:hypothetical protein
MRSAARRVVKKGVAKEKEKSIPAPIGGWNRRDAIADMPETDAIILDNMIPGTEGVSLRNGRDTHVTGLGTYIESLMEYSPPSGVPKLFAAVPTAIYDVTAAGAVGAAAVSSLTNGRWQHTMFATASANFLVLANGADSVRNYDGSSWTTPSITNVSSADLIHVTAHAQRLWFVEKNKLDAWYLGVSAISGAATKLPLGQFCKLGGYLVAIGSWSRDGGSGMDDMWVAVTSNGEVVIYSGTDPSSSTTWTQVGVFKIPPPVGRRCIVKAGSDLGILTAVGLIPLSAVLAANQSGQALVAITDKISGAFKDYYQRSGTAFGWQVIEYPEKQLILVNIPYTERSIQYQAVMNVRTGAWCRFTGFDFGCFSLLGSSLYAGDNTGTVWKYSLEGHDDDGDEISATILQAFTNCGSLLHKEVTQARPILMGPGNYTPVVEIKVDYDTRAPTAEAGVTATTEPLWNVALWNVSFWSSGSVQRKEWQSVSGGGLVIAPAIKISIAKELVINRTDILYEESGLVDA